MGQTFAPVDLPRHIAAHEFASLERCFHDEVRFRALTPGRTHEATGASATAALFASWFGRVDPLDVVGSRAESIRDRMRLSYQLSGAEDGRRFIVDQTAYCTVLGDTIRVMDLVCSGFRFDPVAANATEHDFDAGDLGCGTGLPAEVRRQLTAIAIGDRLRVITRDPSAREDLPALARLLGHRVLSVDAGDVTTTIILERGR